MSRGYVRIRQDNQVTLPAEVSMALHVQEGDLLEVSTQGNLVVLKPTRIPVFESPEGEEAERRAEQDFREGRYRTFDSVESFAEHFEISGLPAAGDRVAERLAAEALSEAHGDAAAAAESLERARKSLEPKVVAQSASSFSE